MSLTLVDKSLGWGPASVMFVATLCCFLGDSMSARAQSVVVNSQGMDLSARSEHWAGQLGFAASYAAGNVQTLRASASTKVQHQRLWNEKDEERAPWLKERWMGLASLSFGRAAEKAVENQGLAHLRWTRMWTRRWGSEVFLQSRFNEFLRLRQRSLVGVGARFDFLNLRGWLGWMGTAYMLEYNQLLGKMPGDPGPWSLEHRWSSYLVLRKSHFDDHLLFQATVFAQPRLDSFSDLRVFGTLDLVAKIASRVGLGVNVALAYDSKPALEVRTTDIRLSSTLSVKLGSI